GNGLPESDGKRTRSPLPHCRRIGGGPAPIFGGRAGSGTAGYAVGKGDEVGASSARDSGIGRYRRTPRRSRVADIRGSLATSRTSPSGRGRGAEEFGTRPASGNAVQDTCLGLTVATVRR